MQSPAACVHTTGITASFGPQARTAIEHAAALVHAQGGLFSVDINYRQRLWPDPVAARQTLTALAASADVLFVTLDEAKLLTDHDVVTESTDDLLALLRKLGPRHVILKAGHGRVQASDAEWTLAADTTEMPEVDPVGAGDAFAAGYLTELISGADLPTRLRTAMTMGSWAVSTHGDNEGLPRRDELHLLEVDNVIR